MKKSKDNFSDNYFRTISGGVGGKPIPPYRGEIMTQEYSTATYIYRRPVCINMEKTHKQLKKEITCEQTPAREPVNNGRIIGTCIECDCVVTQYINLSGCDGGSEKICYPCVADWLNDDHIPYGIKETLDCGCILIDWINGDKYIHLCDDHCFTIIPKIIMSDITGGE